MHRKFENQWVEYRDPIYLMDHLSKMKFNLCWYHKGANNKWTYDLPNHLMVKIETIIALVFMTYIANLDAYEIHPNVEQLLNNYIDEC